ncbi:TPA: RraA family protein [Proteus mirabilis]|nr:RraA family protein [Proteus mirabilis]
MLQKISTNKIALIKRMQLSTPTLVDILDSLGKTIVLNSQLKSINLENFYSVGQAYTVQWKLIRKQKSILNKQPSTWEQVSSFLVPEITDAKGLFYIAGGHELITEAALAGGMSCTYFKKLGFEGVILGGAVRDKKDLTNLTIPVIATNLTPTDTQGAYFVSETGTQCTIEHATICSGDLVISDPNGTVIIPFSLVDNVLEEAIKIDSIENNMLEKIKHGQRLPELINITGRI